MDRETFEAIKARHENCYDGALIAHAFVDMGDLLKENENLRAVVEMFTNRLHAYEVGRVVTVDGPDDPRGRLGSMGYRGSFTNGEWEDAMALLR